MLGAFYLGQTYLGSHGQINGVSPSPLIASSSVQTPTISLLKDTGVLTATPSTQSPTHVAIQSPNALSVSSSVLDPVISKTNNASVLQANTSVQSPVHVTKPTPNALPVSTTIQAPSTQIVIVAPPVLSAASSFQSSVLIASTFLAALSATTNLQSSERIVKKDPPVLQASPSVPTPTVDAGGDVTFFASVLSTNTGIQSPQNLTILKVPDILTALPSLLTPGIQQDRIINPQLLVVLTSLPVPTIIKSGQLFGDNVVYNAPLTNPSSDPNSIADKEIYVPGTKWDGGPI